MKNTYYLYIWNKLIKIHKTSYNLYENKLMVHTVLKIGPDQQVQPV